MIEKGKIYILVPTRDKRASLDTLIESYLKTTKGKSELVILLDQDQSDLYEPMFDDKRYSKIFFVTMERRSLAPKLNAALDMLELEPVMAYGFVGDDCMFISEDWEETVYSKLVQNKGIVYCNDLLKGEELPNNVFIHKSIVDSLGFMCPWELQHYYIDNYWKDLGILTNNIHYFPNLIIEHRHYSNGKSLKDALYEDAEKKFLDPDKTAFDNILISGKLRKDAQIVTDGRKKVSDNGKDT